MDFVSMSNEQISILISDAKAELDKRKSILRNRSFDNLKGIASVGQPIEAVILAAATQGLVLTVESTVDSIEENP